MSTVNKFFSGILTVFFLICGFTFFSSAAAENKNSVEKFFSYEQPLLCISHRGDTVNYPENSLEAVFSAFRKGADFVSVCVNKTADGVFYLCENESLGNICDAPYEKLSQINSAEISKYKIYNVFGEKTDYILTSLTELLDNTEADNGIILDIDFADRDEVYDILKNQGALSRVIIRFNTTATKAVKWAKDKSEKVNVICIYSGNIIFSSVSFVNKLTQADMPAVQFSGKNYFNVAYGNFFTNRYLTDGNVRAIASTYSPDLCGLRSDSADGWNELIKKGYSVIETNNIESFVAYRDEAGKLRSLIADLLDDCPEFNERYSQVSVSNLLKAKENCNHILSSSFFSLDEAQAAYSDLVFCLQEMKISDGKVDTRGALNITAGKMIAAVVVGAALLCGQIYVFKMRKKNK